MKRCPIGGMMALVLLSVLSFHGDARVRADPMLLAAASAEPGASAVDFNNDRVVNFQDFARLA